MSLFGAAGQVARGAAGAGWQLAKRFTKGVWGAGKGVARATGLEDVARRAGATELAMSAVFLPASFHGLTGGTGAVSREQIRGASAPVHQIAPPRVARFNSNLVPSSGPQVDPMSKGASSTETLRKIAHVLARQEQEKTAAAPRRLLAKVVRDTAGKAAKSKPSPMGFQEGMKQVLPMLAFGAASAGTAAGIGLGVEGIRYAAGRAGEAAHVAKQGKRYQAMLKADPSLKEHPRARQMFNVLDKVSPFVAGEPVLAASAVRSMIEQPTYNQDPHGLPLVGMDRISQLLNIQTGRNNTRFGGRGKASDLMVGAQFVPTRWPTTDGGDAGSDKGGDS